MAIAIAAADPRVLPLPDNFQVRCAGQVKNRETDEKKPCSKNADLRRIMVPEHHVPALLNAVEYYKKAHPNLLFSRAEMLKLVVEQNSIPVSHFCEECYRQLQA